MQQPTSHHSRPRRLLTAVVGALAVFSLTATVAFAESNILSMTEVNSAFDRMGASHDEFSGATYNADRNVIVLVDDETGVFEYDLDASGTIDFETPVRELTNNIGAGDYEGIAWLDGERYAILSEGTGTAYIVTIPLVGSTISASDVESSVVVGGPDGNEGSEGIDVDDDGNWYVVDEMPASLSKYTPEGVLVDEVFLPQLGDATGVVVAEDGSYVVISHESKKLIHIEVDWDAGTHVQLAERNLPTFNQLEGIALIGNSDLHLFAEEKAGGQVWSHLEGEVVLVPQFEETDVDCSGSTNILDALVITRIEVGIAEATPGCGSGDSNGDGAANVLDALLIAQCTGASTT